MRHRAKFVLACMLLLVSTVMAGCQKRPSFDSQVRASVAPYRFNFVGWELSHLLGLEQPRGAASELMQEGQNWDILRSTLKAQILDTLHEMEIYNSANPYFGLKISFPPLWFDLTTSPNLLVISPRDKIENVRSVMLIQGLAPEARDTIEEQVSALGVSALVEPLGGFAGLYPSLVVRDMPFPFVSETIIHEWFHQYLAFTPLGFRYILDVTGIAPNYDVATMNETAVSMVAKEVNNRLLEQYYPEYAKQEEGEQAKPKQEVDFNQEMRMIRLQVDSLLIAGHVDQAEQYMEERRQFLASQGYHIRKLNQAYFAFYGTYADEPTSVSSIGQDLRILRAQSDSPAAFLYRVMEMRNRQDLQRAISNS